MHKPVIHKQVYRRGPFGGVVNRTVCGHQSGQQDDMNVAAEDQAVTCKICLRMIERRPELAVSVSAPSPPSCREPT